MANVIDKIKERIEKARPAEVRGRRVLKEREKRIEKTKWTGKKQKIEEMVDQRSLRKKEIEKLERLVGEVETKKGKERAESKKKIKEMGQQAQKVISRFDKVGKKTTRAYKKSSRWHKTRYSGAGKYRSPSQTKGLRAGKFNVGGHKKGRSIAEIGIGEPVTFGIKSPLRKDESEFKKASDILDIGIGNVGKGIDLSVPRPREKEKRERKWF